jgi:hypothetical protein
MTIKPDNWDWWIGSWKGLITCGKCLALMHLDAPCPVCNQDYRNTPAKKIEINGKTIEMPPAFAGAISLSEFLLLKLMYQEWQVGNAVNKLVRFSDESPASPRLLIVILSWSLFENLMQRLFETGMRTLPAAISKELLNRHSTVGSRMDRLYKIVFDSTLEKDLKSFGYDQLWEHLSDLQKRRNAFIHGNPEVVDDALINRTIENLPILQEAWVRLYNFRCTQ